MSTPVSCEVMLPWGDTTVGGRWPGDVDYLCSRGVEAAGDPAAETVRAFEHPAGCAPLAEAARGARAAVVVVSDHTRETAARVLTPAVVECLVSAGIPSSAVKIVVAYGNHTRATNEAILDLLGDVPADVELLHHDSRDDAQLIGVGKLPSGKELRLNRHVVEADMLVVTGAITFHYHAGFTAGRKAVLPGVASCANILANHFRTLGGDGSDANGGRDPNCQPGRLEGNPVSEEMGSAARLLAARLARQPFLVNSVLTEDGDLAAVFAGDLFEAHGVGTAYVGEHFRVPVAERFDVAFASAGGYPRDGSFYQAHKAFDHAARAVRDGGVVVLAAECRHGPGSGFIDWFDHATYDEHLSALRKDFAVPGQTALALRQKLGRIRGILVSRMDAGDVKRMGLAPARDMAEAFEMAREVLGEGGARACLMPHASMILPS